MNGSISRFKVSALPLDVTKPFNVISPRSSARDIGHLEGPFDLPTARQHIRKKSDEFLLDNIGLGGAFNPFTHTAAELKSDNDPEAIRLYEHETRTHNIIEKQLEPLLEAIIRSEKKGENVDTAILETLEKIWDTAPQGAKGLATLLKPLKVLSPSDSERKHQLEADIVSNIRYLIEGYQLRTKDSWHVQIATHDTTKIVDPTTHGKTAAACAHYSGIKQYYSETLGDSAVFFNSTTQLHEILAGYVMQSHSKLMNLLADPRSMKDPFHQILAEFGKEEVLKDLRIILADEKLKETFFHQLYTFIAIDTSASSEEGYLSLYTLNENRRNLDHIKQILTLESLASPNALLKNLKESSTPQQFKELFVSHLAMYSHHKDEPDFEQKMNALYEDAMNILCQHTAPNVSNKRKHNIEQLMEQAYLVENQSYMTFFASHLAKATDGKLPASADDMAKAIKLELLLIRYAKLNQPEEAAKLRLLTYTNQYVTDAEFFTEEEVDHLWDLRDKTFLSAMQKLFSQKGITPSGNEMKLIHPAYKTEAFNNTDEQLAIIGEAADTLDMIHQTTQKDTKHERFIKWLLRLDRHVDRFGFRVAEHYIRRKGINAQREYAKINQETYGKTALLPKKLEEYVRFQQLCNQKIPQDVLLKTTERKNKLTKAYEAVANIPYQDVVKDRIESEPYVPHQTRAWLIMLLSLDAKLAALQMLLTVGMGLSHGSSDVITQAGGFFFNLAMIFYGSDSLLYENYILKSGLARDHDSIPTPERDLMKRSVQGYLYNAFPGIACAVGRLINGIIANGRNHKLLFMCGSAENTISNLRLYHDLQKMETRAKFINREIVRPFFGLEKDKPTEQYAPYEQSEKNDANIASFCLNLTTPDATIEPIESDLMKTLQDESLGYNPRNHLTAGLYMNLHWMIAKDPKHPNGTNVVKLALEKFIKELPELQLFDNSGKNEFIKKSLEYKMNSIIQGTGLKDFILGKPFDDYFIKLFHVDMVGSNKLTESEFNLLLKALQDNRDHLIIDAIEEKGSKATTKIGKLFKTGIDPMFSRAIGYKLIDRVRNQQGSHEIIAEAGQKLLGGLALEADELDRTVQAMKSLFNFDPEHSKDILKQIKENSARILAVSQEAAHHYETVISDTAKREEGFALLSHLEEEYYIRNAEIKYGAGESNENLHITKTFLEWEKIRDGILAQTATQNSSFTALPTWELEGCVPSSYFRKMMDRFGMTEELLREAMSKRKGNVSEALADIELFLVKKVITDGKKGKDLSNITEAMDRRIENKLDKDKYQKMIKDLPQQSDYFIPIKLMPSVAGIVSSLDRADSPMRLTLMRSSTSESMAREVLNNIFGLQNLQSGQVLDLSSRLNKIIAENHLTADEKIEVMKGHSIKGIKIETPEAFTYEQLSYQIRSQQKQILEEKLYEDALDFLKNVEQIVAFESGDIQGIATQAVGTTLDIYYSKLSISDGAADAILQQTMKNADAVDDLKELFSLKIPTNAFDKIIYKHKFNGLPMTSMDIHNELKRAGYLDNEGRLINFRYGDNLIGLDPQIQPFLVQRIEEILWQPLLGDFRLRSQKNEPSSQNRFYDTEQRLQGVKKNVQEEIGNILSKLKPSSNKHLEEINAKIEKTKKEFDHIMESTPHLKALSEKIDTLKRRASEANPQNSDELRSQINAAEIELNNMMAQKPELKHLAEMIDNDAKLAEGINETQQMDKSIKSLIATLLTAAKAGVADKYAGKFQNDSSIYDYDQLKEIVYNLFFGENPTLNLGGVSAVYRDSESDVLNQIKLDIEDQKKEINDHRKKMKSLIETKQEGSDEYKILEALTLDQELLLLDKAKHLENFQELILSLRRDTTVVKQTLGREALTNLKYSFDELFSVIEHQAQLMEDITIRVCGMPLESQDMNHGKVPTELINPLSERIYTFLSTQGKTLTEETHVALGEQISKWLLVDKQDKNSGLMLAGHRILEMNHNDRGTINKMLSARERGIFSRITGVDSIESEAIRKEVIRENPIDVDIYTSATLRTNSKGRKGGANNNKKHGNNYFSQMGFHLKTLLTKSITEKVGVHYGPGEVNNPIEQTLMGINFIGTNNDKEKEKRGITSPNIYNILRDGVIHGNQGVVLKTRLLNDIDGLSKTQLNQFFELDSFSDSKKVFIFRSDFEEKLHEDKSLSPTQRKAIIDIYERSKTINSLTVDLVASWNLEKDAVIHPGTSFKFKNNKAHEQYIVQSLQNIAKDMMPRYFALFELKGIYFALREIYFKAQNPQYVLRNTDHPHFKIATGIYKDLTGRDFDEDQAKNELKTLDVGKFHNAILNYFNANTQNIPEARWSNLSKDYTKKEWSSIKAEIEHQISRTLKMGQEDLKLIDKVEQKNRATAILSRVIELAVQNETDKAQFKPHAVKDVEDTARAIFKAMLKKKEVGKLFDQKLLSRELIRHLEKGGVDSREIRLEMQSLVEKMNAKFETIHDIHLAKTVKIVRTFLKNENFTFTEAERKKLHERGFFTDEKYSEEVKFYKVAKFIHTELKQKLKNDKTLEQYLARLRSNTLSQKENLDLSDLIKGPLAADEFGLNSKGEFLEMNSDVVLSTIKDLQDSIKENLSELRHLNYTFQFKGEDIKGSWNNQVNKYEPRSESDEDAEWRTALIGKTWVGKYTGLYSPDLTKGGLSKLAQGQTMRLEAVIPGHLDARGVMATESAHRTYFKFDEGWLPKTQLYDGINRPLMDYLEDAARVIDEKGLLSDINEKTPRKEIAILMEKKLPLISKHMRDIKKETGSAYTEDVLSILGEEHAHLLDQFSAEITAGKREFGADSIDRINALNLDEGIKAKLLELEDRIKRPYNEIITDIALLSKIFQNASETLSSYIQEYDEEGNPINGFILALLDYYAVDKDNIVWNGTHPTDKMTSLNIYSMPYDSTDHMPVNNTLISVVGGQHTLQTLPYDYNIEDSFSVSSAVFKKYNRGAMNDDDKVVAGGALGEWFSMGCHLTNRTVLSADIATYDSYMETEEPELNLWITKALVKAIPDFHPVESIYAYLKKVKSDPSELINPENWVNASKSILSAPQRIGQALSKENLDKAYTPAEKARANFLISQVYRTWIGNGVLTFGMPIAIAAILTVLGAPAAAIPVSISLAFALKKALTRTMYYEHGYGIIDTWRAWKDTRDPSKNQYEAQENFKQMQKILLRNAGETASYIALSVALSGLAEFAESAFSITDIGNLGSLFDPKGVITYGMAGLFGLRYVAMNMLTSNSRKNDPDYFKNFYDLTKKRSMAKTGQNQRAFIAFTLREEGPWQALEDSIKMQTEIFFNKLVKANRFVASYNPPETTPSGVVEMFNDRWIALAIRYGHESFMRKFAQKENKGIMFQIMNMVNYPRMMAYFNFYMPIYLIAQLAFGTSLIPFQTKLSFNMGRHEFDFFNQDINLVSIFGATSIVRMMMMRYLHNAAAANAGVPAHIAKMQHGHQYLNLYRLHQEFIKNSPKAGNVQGEEFKTTAQPVGYMGDMSSQNLNNWKMYSNWKKQQGDTNDAFHMGWVRTNLQLTSLLQGELILNLLRSEGPGYTDLVNFGLLSYWLHDWHYNLDLADQMSQGGAEKRVRIYGVEYERNQQLFGIQGPTRQYSSVLPSLGILSIVSLVGATMPLAALVAGNITFNIALNLFISKLKKELNHEVKSQAGKDAIVGVASVVLAAGAETIAAGFGIIPILGPIISPFVAPTTALWLKSLFIQNASATTWELYANIPKGKTIKALIKYATNKTFKLGAPEKVHLANAYPFNKQNERSPFPALDSRIQTDRSLSKIASFMRSSATKQKTMTLSLKEQAWVDFMQENPDLSTELMGKDYKLNSQEKVVRSLAKLKKVLLASQDDINKIVEITLLLQRGNTDTTESELSNAMSRFAEMVKDDKDRSLITDQKALADYLHEHKDYDLADFFYKQLEFLNQDPVENYKNRVDMYKELNQPFKASLVRPKLNKRRNDLSRTQ